MSFRDGLIGVIAHAESPLRLPTCSIEQSGDDRQGTKMTALALSESGTFGHDAERIRLDQFCFLFSFSLICNGAGSLCHSEFHLLNIIVR